VPGGLGSRYSRRDARSFPPVDFGHAHRRRFDWFLRTMDEELKHRSGQGKLLSVVATCGTEVTAVKVANEISSTLTAFI
jgi:hypothetical protein